VLHLLVRTPRGPNLSIAAPRVRCIVPAVSTDSRLRLRAWTLSWLAYATYYVGRKGFGVVKKPLQQELGLSVGALGAIDTAFLAAYTGGQFLSGFAGDRIGARRLVGFGMLASAAACGLFGLSTGVVALIACFFLNGLAQSTGWPGTTRTMAEWTTKAERGTVMGFWSTCYQVGGVLATLLAGEVAQRYGWRAAFFVAALALLGVGLMVLGFLPTREVAPDAASAPVESAGPRSGREGADDAEAQRRERRAAQWAVVTSPRLWLYGSSYFFIKLIRYALLFWLPYYLTNRFGYGTSDAARLSTAFDAGGIAGVIVIGRLSDRLPWRGRAAWALLFLVTLVFALVGYVRFAQAGFVLQALLLGIVGALLFGPDALLSGAVAQDAGGVHAPAMATGFVNGLGSIGALLQGLLVPALAARFGWSALFPVFIVFAACAALVLLPTLRVAQAR